MSWKSQDFPLQYRDFLHPKSGFPHLKSNFSHMKSNLPILAFYFLQRLTTFFIGFLTFFNGFPLSPMAFQFSSTAFQFPRNPRKSIYGEKYTKDRYSSFVFFATLSPSFIIPAKQYLHLTQQKHDTLFQYIRYNTIIKYHSLANVILKKVTNEWYQTCPIQV
jgi:hypothetical protein